MTNNLTHKELMQMHLGLNAQGDIVYSLDGFATSKVAVKACAIDPRFARILAASGFMYVLLSEAEPLLDEYVKLLEDQNKDNLAMQLVKLVASIKFARKRALPLDG